MNVHGYELTKDWSVSNVGMIAQATKDGRKYLLKKYCQYKMPVRGASTSESLYRRLEAEFNDFKNNRIAINEALSSFAGPGGNIVLPSDWFVDGIEYVEATEFVPNVVEDEDVLKLPREDLLLIMLTASAALGGMHRQNIVHSDLKRTNLLVAKNGFGKNVAKIIDMDRSYFVNNIRPDEIGGDQSFMSPELVQCFIYDMADEALALLSTKSDIFSLGLIFYNYLTGGKFPEYQGLSGKLKERFDSGTAVYCGEVSLAGASLVIGKEIGDLYLKRLLAAMLQSEPEDRPTAQEVMQILKLKTVIDAKATSCVVIEDDTGASTGASTPTTSTSTGTATRGGASTTGTSTTGTTRTGTTSTTTTSTSTSAETVPTGFCAPWPEHTITIKEDVLRASGFIAMAQVDVKGAKNYKLFKAKGGYNVYSSGNLVLAGFATDDKKKEASATVRKPAKPTVETKVEATAEPWETDGEYKFDVDKIVADNFKEIRRAEKGSVKGYVLVKNDGSQRFLVMDSLKILGYAVKK